MTEAYKRIKDCNACNLYKNQVPLVQVCLKADVFWVGLSAVKTANTDEMPLAINTNSGKLVKLIEVPFHNNSFYKTNIVKCLPLENQTKIRYPSTKEMRSCFFHLKEEMTLFKPKIIFLLGTQVAKFILGEFGIKDFTLNKEFDYSTIAIDDFIFVPIHHPSYILIYKRKYRKNYICGIQNIIKEIEKKNILFEQRITKNRNHNFSKTTYLTSIFKNDRNISSIDSTKYSFIHRKHSSFLTNSTNLI